MEGIVTGLWLIAATWSLKHGLNLCCYQRERSLFSCPFKRSYLSAPSWQPQCCTLPHPMPTKVICTQVRLYQTRHTRPCEIQLWHALLRGEATYKKTSCSSTAPHQISTSTATRWIISTPDSAKASKNISWWTEYFLSCSKNERLLRSCWDTTRLLTKPWCLGTQSVQAKKLLQEGDTRE